MATMGSSGKAQARREIEETLGLVPEWLDRMPEGMAVGFWTVMRDLELADTKIPRKYKELIGIGVSGATRCRYCTLFHTEAARLNGATDEEIAEASAFAAYSMMGSTYLNAMQTDYGQFKKDTLAIVDHVRRSQGQKPRPREQARV